MTQDYASGGASVGEFVPVAAIVTLLMTWADRITRLSFRSVASGVAIRNYFSTRRVLLAQFTGFDVGQRSAASPRRFRGNAPLAAF